MSDSMNPSPSIPPDASGSSEDAGSSTGSSSDIQGVVPSGRPTGLAIRPVDQGLVLRSATAEEFLPAIAPWQRFAGLFLVSSFCAGIALMAVWPYRVVVRGPGMTRPSGETNVVHAPRDGRVREIRILANQSVRKGQVLAVLDPTDLQGRRLKLQADDQALQRERISREQENKASLEAAQLEVEKAAAALQFAESEYARYSQLVESGAGSVQQMEEKAANLKVARSALSKARQQVEEQRSRGQSQLAQLSQRLSENLAERAQLGRDLGSTLVRSPADGIVFSVALRNPLQVVSAGQELARIAPRQKNLQVKVLVPSSDIANVQKGQRADLRITGCPYPDFGTLPGRVVSIAPDAVMAGPGREQEAAGSNPAPTGAAPAGGGTYEVTIQPDRTELRAGSRRCELRLGMDLNADITTRVETVLQFLLRKIRLLTTW